MVTQTYCFDDVEPGTATTALPDCCASSAAEPASIRSADQTACFISFSLLTIHLGSPRRQRQRRRAAHARPRRPRLEERHVPGIRVAGLAREPALVKLVPIPAEEID